MRAEVIRVEQGVNQTTKTGKKITVTEFEYRGEPYKGKTKEPTIRSLFTNHACHSAIIALNPGDWVQMSFDGPYKDIVGLEVIGNPGESSPTAPPPGQPSKASPTPRAAPNGNGEYGLYPQGATPKNRGITIEACLKIVALGLPEFASVEELWVQGEQLYNKVISFSNEPIKYIGCVDKMDLEEIEGNLAGSNCDRGAFWRWLADKASMNYLVDGPEVNPRLLKASHATFLVDNLGDKIVEFEMATKSDDKTDSRVDDSMTPPDGAVIPSPEQTTFPNPDEEEMPPF